VKLEDIEKSIAAVGHDTQNFSSEISVYKKLPGCCKYDRKSTGKNESSKKGDNHSGHNH
jgi:periplasmic mercuric ion binding protein